MQIRLSSCPRAGIVETGTHNELLQKQGAYYLLVQAQNIRTENEKQESANLEVEKEDLARSQTANSELSVSAQVVHDLENEGHYDATAKTRSTWALLALVSTHYFCFHSFY